MFIQIAKDIELTGQGVFPRATILNCSALQFCRILGNELIDQFTFVKECVPNREPFFRRNRMYSVAFENCSGTKSSFRFTIR